MDSKLRRMAIVASIAVILLVALLVLYVNENNSPKPGPAHESPESSEPIPTEVPEDNLKGFLEDPFFFDKEPLIDLGNYGRTLSLTVTSVEKNLRVKIVDIAGNLVTGEDFLVVLEGVGEYADSDGDGVVTIDNLKAGEYYVSLKERAGYRVPENEIKVRVRDKVEYRLIDDIALFIHSEEDVDAQTEDITVAEALDDTDKTEITKLQASSGGKKVGIDISKEQGDVDWDKVKNAGVKFAIIRAGYRGAVSGQLVEDPYFVKNMKGVQSGRIPVGVYFSTQAINEVEAVEEASAVLKLIKEYQITYPVFLDLDSAYGNGRADGLDAETRTRICEAFCKTIENEGYKAGIYGARGMFNDKLHAEKLAAYTLWLAEYRGIPLYQGYYSVWQYTSKATVSGISGNVNLNISYLEN